MWQKTNSKYTPNYNSHLLPQLWADSWNLKNNKLVLLQTSIIHIRKLFYLNPLKKY